MEAHKWEIPHEDSRGYSSSQAFAITAFPCFGLRELRVQAAMRSCKTKKQHGFVIMPFSFRRRGSFQEQSGIRLQFNISWSLLSSVSIVGSPSTSVTMRAVVENIFSRNVRGPESQNMLTHSSETSWCPLQ